MTTDTEVIYGKRFAGPVEAQSWLDQHGNTQKTIYSCQRTGEVVIADRPESGDDWTELSRAELLRLAEAENN